ncbi:transporter substrate-binding domain-containing protein [Moraxella nasovis]|uniref:amino acid ABC transporter substrate-binding protein n=1 Tax=Moraxella nasovis TaxID=2904121 RepID=UPI001F606BD2|nr:amino acid ABC transporter substrate-binding protein [Moraxella nasovis]UNU72566.1 transporter substrate-binding domain-containing protein [Moraxella nasovis]
MNISLKWASLAIAFAVTLVGCDNSAKQSTTQDNVTTAGAESDLLERINNHGTITVGTEGTYPPFTYHDETGNLTGYDVEVTRAIADKLGVTVEFKETQWDAMMAGLDAKRFDAIANQMSLTTPERQAKYDKSEPYSWSNSVIVAPKNIKIEKWEDVKDKKSAQSMSSHYAEVAEQYGAILVPVDGMAQAITLVEQGRADMTVNDKLAIIDYFKQKPNQNLEIKIEGGDASVRGAGLAFRKHNDEAVAKISQATKELKADGTLARLGEQFFGQDISNQPTATQ